MRWLMCLFGIAPSCRDAENQSIMARVRQVSDDHTFMAAKNEARVQDVIYKTAAEDRLNRLRLIEATKARMEKNDTLDAFVRGKRQR